MEFSQNLCFTGLHLRWPPEFGYFVCGELIITFIHGASQVFLLSIILFFYATLRLIQKTKKPSEIAQIMMPMETLNKALEEREKVLMTSEPMVFKIVFYNLFSTFFLCA